ncbi:MAG TPA: hypothetical protein VGX91_07850 [Candidatus Cybelea sp.]|nr:hypothetical protein [Candidatus Cybelea sp.]
MTRRRATLVLVLRAALIGAWATLRAALIGAWATLRATLIGAWATLRATLILVLRATLLTALVLTATLLGALLHRLAMGTHLLAVLILLVAVQHAHDLVAQVAGRAGIARAALGVRLRVLIDERLDALLLVAGEVEIAEAFHPAMLDLRCARRRFLGLASGRLALLGRGADRHCERSKKRARRQKVDLHRLDLTRRPRRAREPAIRTYRAA